jgi:hypothetical protein
VESGTAKLWGASARGFQVFDRARIGAPGTLQAHLEPYRARVVCIKGARRPDSVLTASIYTHLHHALITRNLL